MNPALDARKLLLVDDDRLVLATLASGLEEAGYAVRTADSAEAALELVDEETPDLAVLDLRMPGQSGLELARRLRETTRVPLIFLTAYSEREAVREAAEHGALSYLVKPVDVPQLVPAIEAALARAADLRVLRESERRLQSALDEGRQVSIATGLIMERRHLDREEAFELLRAAARSQRRKLREVADEVLHATEILNLGPGPR